MFIVSSIACKRVEVFMFDTQSDLVVFDLLSTSTYQYFWACSTDSIIVSIISLGL